MLKIIIIIYILFIVTFQGFGQEIEVNSNGIFFNSHHITIDSSRDSLLHLLGEPNRKSNITDSGDYSYWIYDELGIRLVFAGNLESIEINFKPEERVVFPKQNFTGDLTVFGINLSGNTPITEVKKIKELNFEKNVSSDNGYVARVKNLVLLFGYNPDTFIINHVSINQKIYVLIDFVNSNKLNDSVK